MTVDSPAFARAWLDQAQRNPLLSLRLPGSFLWRLPARRFGGLLFHDLPRGLPTACVGLLPTHP